MILNIFTIDDITEETPITSLTLGIHTVGRGDLLKISDKRVSRKHAIIDISTENISITPVHINPCFYKAASGSVLRVLEKDQRIEISDGDQIGLLADDCWFKVKIKHEADGRGSDILNNLTLRLPSPVPTSLVDVNAHQSSINKRTFEQPELNCSSHKNNHNTKKQKLSPAIENNLTGVANENNEHEKLDNPESNVDHDENIINDTTTNKQENDQLYIKQENGPEQSTVGNNCFPSMEHIDELPSDDTDRKPSENNILIKTEPDEASSSTYPNYACNNESNNNNADDKNADDKKVLGSALTCNKNSGDQDGDNKQTADDSNRADGQPSGSNQGTAKSRRERCWYGPSCYRKNPIHRQEFSHPGDNDYDSDPDDDRPNCPFGAVCYRRNLEHRRQFKHPNRPAPRPSKLNVQVIRVNTMCGCSYCDHCKEKFFRKPGYESDSDSDDEAQLHQIRHLKTPNQKLK